MKLIEIGGKLVNTDNICFVDHAERHCEKTRHRYGNRHRVCLRRLENTGPPRYGKNRIRQYNKDVEVLEEKIRLDKEKQDAARLKEEDVCLEYKARTSLIAMIGGLTIVVPLSLEELTKLLQGL